MYALAVDSHHPGVLFAGTFQGLYRSDNDGDSWARVAFFENATVIGVTFDPRAPDTVFAVIEGNSFNDVSTLVWKSTDGGTTWTSSALPAFSYSRLLRFVFDPVRPEVLYLFYLEYLSPGPVMRSSDGGASWSALPAGGIRDLAAAPDGTLWAEQVPTRCQVLRGFGRRLCARAQKRTGSPGATAGEPRPIAPLLFD